MAHDLLLPMQVTSRSDIGRLVRELQAAEQVFEAAHLRGKEAHSPKVSGLLDQILEDNKLKLTHADDRKKLAKFLEYMKADAPVLHFSFSVDPSAAFLDKLMTWLRREIHPQLLVTIGLQPTIGAGCIVRSTNKQFDLSLKNSFASKRSMLMESLGPRKKGQIDMMRVVEAPEE